MIKIPFKSRSQVRKFGELVKQGKMSKVEFQKWLDETPSVKSLPERIGKKSKSKKKSKKKK